MSVPDNPHNPAILNDLQSSVPLNLLSNPVFKGDYYLFKEKTLALLNIQNATLSFSAISLFDQLNIQIHEGEKICLLGRNGAGKSTFMKMISGGVEPDSGEVIREKGMKTSILHQDVPVDLIGTIGEVIATGLISHGADNYLADADHHPAHEIDRIISLLGLDETLRFENLSAGMKRKVLLGRALVSDPDILLLDEPTNHLDMDSILWLEEFLSRYRKTIFFVTHDRTFLQKIAGRIIELDRGKLYDWKCGYNTFLQRKEEWLDGEHARNAVFDKKLASEEIWVRKGIKARRTRNEGRVRALQKLRAERGARREISGSVKLQLQRSDVSGKMIIEAENVSFGYDSAKLISGFTTRILRGDKIGIIGPNGCGKSTLVKILLNSLQPDSGTVRTGSGLQVVYYDQLRVSIDPSLTVKENIMGKSEIIDFNGKQKHVIGYLSDFLFPPAMADMRAEVLSGGEKNRLMLAKLFIQPFNFLVMDEPTNDLDIETIELLEELLLDYEGTLLLVSHDRSFINNIVNSVYAFEGKGLVNEYAGGYDDWLSRQISSSKNNNNPPSAVKEKKDVQRAKTKLSMKEKHELASIPPLIEIKEKRKKEIYNTLADPSFYQKNGADVVLLKNEIGSIDAELEKIFARWEELESYE